MIIDKRDSLSHHKQNRSFVLKFCPLFVASEFSREKLWKKKKNLIQLFVWQNPKTGERGTLTDRCEMLDVKSLRNHISIVISALMRHVYNRSVDDVLKGGLVSRSNEVVLKFTIW